MMNVGGLGLSSYGAGGISPSGVTATTSSSSKKAGGIFEEYQRLVYSEILGSEFPDFGKIRRFCEFGNINLLTCCQVSGMTTLHRICVCGDKNMLDLAQVCISQKADVNARNHLGRTPIHICCEYNRVNLLAYLLRQEGADINQLSIGNSTPLHIACTNDSFEVIELLLSEPFMNKIITNTEDNHRQTPLAILKAQQDRYCDSVSAVENFAALSTKLQQQQKKVPTPLANLLEAHMKMNLLNMDDDNLYR